MRPKQDTDSDLGSAAAAVAIRTTGLTKRFETDDGPVVALDSLDLEVQKGEIFGFLGPNGAGKSTTINILLDYIRPSAGTATVLGLDPQQEAELLRRRIGVVPEGYGLYDRLTGRRHIDFAIEWMDADAEVEALLDRVGLDHEDAARPVSGYSTGMRQRLALAMALVGEPALLILDEPSSGLDPHGIRLMQDIVEEEAARGATVFFSSHILDHVEAVCDRVGILADGGLVGVDSVDALRDAVGRSSVLQLRIDGEVPIDPVGIDGVDWTEREDGVLHVSCADPRAKARVVAQVHDSGGRIVDLEVDSPSLEEVFSVYTAGDQPAVKDRPHRRRSTEGR